MSDIPFQEEILRYVNERRALHKTPEFREPIMRLSARATTIVILSHNNLYQPIPLSEENQFMKENNVYRIYDKSYNQTMHEVADRVALSIRKTDSCRGINGNSRMLTSFLVMKVDGCKYPMPLSRGTVTFEYNPDADTNPGDYGLYFGLYPQSFTQGTIFCQKIKDIEYIDVIVTTTVNAFKKALKRKENAEKVLNNLSTNDTFNELLV
jgi:hypothetical protein